MLHIIEGLPPDVLGVEAVGKVTHEDYRSVLIPKAEALMAKGPIKMIYVVGKQFTGYELEALWDDAAFGMKHWRQFDRIAVVTDHSWMRSSVSLFVPLLPATVRLFGNSELAAAKEWIAAPRQVGA